MSSQEKPLFISCPLPLNSHSPKPSQPEHRLICNRFPLLCLVGTQKVAKGECSLKERTHKRGNSAPPHSCQFSPPGLKLGPSSPRAKTAPGPRVSQAFQRRPAQPLPLLLTGLPVLVHQVTDVCTLHFHPAILLHMVHIDNSSRIVVPVGSMNNSPAAQVISLFTAKIWPIAAIHHPIGKGIPATRGEHVS